jgi:hypothetical protein
MPGKVLVSAWPKAVFSWLAMEFTVVYWQSEPASEAIMAGCVHD